VIPVAYGRVDTPDYRDGLIAAVPLTLAQEEIEQAAERVEEMLVLTTVLLAVLIIVATSLVAGSVARPVRELVSAAGRIAAGDYSARLEPRSTDEVARLVREFNTMAEALGAQRADLERRRDYMQALLTNATTGVISTNAAGTIVTVNPAAEKLLSVHREPPEIGDDLIESVSRDPKLAPLARALGRHGPAGDPRETDLEIDGETRRMRSVRVDLPTPFGDAPGALVLLDDVTDLMRSNQLAAWAEMAQAIAHEIKNPLTPIQLSTEHLERLLEDRGALPSDELQACLDNVMKQVQALREIASEFSTYAKLPSLTLEPTDPDDLLRDVLSPYRSAPPASVEVRERYGGAPTIRIDRRVLARAIVNLVENALQAMPGGGTLTVGTATDADDAVLFVEDTGPGLAPDVRARLFEPYFSTKSSGTGLGLAIVRRSVEAHGGRIDIESTAGRGTAFRIRLPRVSTEATVYSTRGDHEQEKEDEQR
jgi:two-component system nitrogen regulation sensor histidine kinase NtrY